MRNWKRYWGFSLVLPENFRRINAASRIVSPATIVLSSPKIIVDELSPSTPVAAVNPKFALLRVNAEVVATMSAIFLGKFNCLG